MNTISKSASLGSLGLPSGDHWVRFHVEGESISFEVAASVPRIAARGGNPTGFVEKWGGTAKKIEDPDDAWLTRINDKHLKDS